MLFFKEQGTAPSFSISGKPDGRSPQVFYIKILIAWMILKKDYKDLDLCIDSTYLK